MRATLPMPSPLAEHFMLDPGVVFLNHGSFGATPRAVYQKMHDLHARMEADPIRFFVADLEAMLDDARRRVAAFLDAPADDLAFVTNATEGVNTVVKSLVLHPGDELLTSSHEYNACNNALADAAARSGAVVKRVRTVCPVAHEDEVIAAVHEAVTPRTKLLLLSHITSPSAIVLPVARLVSEVQARGVDVMLDSAHGPGYVPLSVRALRPAYFTANLHKWCCAPKGAAVLYVRPDRQERVKPMTLSHGDNSPRAERSRFRLNFDFVGSRDYTPWLLAPESIDLIGSLCGGWAKVIEHNHALADHAERVLLDALQKWGARTLAPRTMLGAMRAITIPTPSGGVRGPTRYLDPLQDRLLDRRRIQVPIHTVVSADGVAQRVCRISAMIYNAPAQYEYLAASLAAELDDEARNAV